MWAGDMETLRLIVVSMRPQQWAKNVLVFAAVVFSGRFLDVDALLASLLCFASFCLVSGAIYIFNDIVDRESDRLHPLKKARPIASGELSVGAASVAAMVAALAGLAVALYVSFAFADASILVFVVVLVYLLLQIAYTLLLKHLVILDVMTLSAGFVLRVLAGGVAIDAQLSYWAIICTILLALFMGFGKRRHEIILLNDAAISHRRSLGEYSPYFLDQMIAVTTASTVMAYALYTMSSEVIEKLGTDKLIVTLPFVIYGIFRYLYLVHRRDVAGDPTRALLTDPPLMVSVMLWFITVVILLYFKP